MIYGTYPRNFETKNRFQIPREIKAVYRQQITENPFLLREIEGDIIRFYFPFFLDEEKYIRMDRNFKERSEFFRKYSMVPISIKNEFKVSTGVKEMSQSCLEKRFNTTLEPSQTFEIEIECNGDHFYIDINNIKVVDKSKYIHIANHNAEDED
jgi:hypothetical protein